MARQRGRKGAAQLSVVVPIGPTRPEPPRELLPAEAEVWRLTVSAMKPDWFGAETHPLLRAYCTHVALVQWLGAELRDLAVDTPAFRKLASMHCAQSKMIASLATKLRITPQSNRRSSRDGRSPTPPGPRPWEFT